MWWLDSITNLMDMNLSKLQQTVEHTGDWNVRSRGHKESNITQQLNNNISFE